MSIYGFPKTHRWVNKYMERHSTSNANQNHNGEHLTPVRTHPTEHTSAGEHAEKREPLCAQSVAV